MIFVQISVHHKFHLKVQCSGDVNILLNITTLFVDVSTRYSSKCCEDLLSEDCRAIMILLNVIHQDNRSVPHMELVSVIFDVFLNLIKYDKVRPVLNSIAEFFDTTVNVMTRYREKNHTIVAKCCAVLWIAAHEENGRQVRWRKVSLAQSF